jgi:hypothetical protein
MIFGRSARAEKARPANNRDKKIRFIKTRLCLERNPFKYQKAVYFIFIMICNKTLVFYQPLALMKKTLLPILALVVYLFGSISATAEDHKPKLHEIGERIKQAVKGGKLTEKEGWAKWHAVLREHGHKEKHNHDEDEWEETEDLEHEIEILELEFELERLEHEHEIQRMEWNHERERMERDFDRERREWEMENLQWEMRRKQMEMQMRAGPRPGVKPPHVMPPHGTRHPHGMKPPHAHQGPGPKPDMRRGGPPRGMSLPQSRGHAHEQTKKPSDSKCGATASAKGKSDCGKSEKKSCCGKCKSGCDKKDSCKGGECKKSDSCPKKDSSCKAEGESCPLKKADCPDKKRTK